MAYGTAPRLVNGVWTTRHGKKLSAAGQAYWSRKKSEGFTDGSGHVNRSSVVAAKAPGLITPGNIDIRHRPSVPTPGKPGYHSSVRSVTVTDDQGRAHLIPTVINVHGKWIVDTSPRSTQAIAHWRKTGQHLGVFANEKAANAYAGRLHEQQAGMTSAPPLSARDRKAAQAAAFVAQRTGTFKPTSAAQAREAALHPKAPTPEQLDAKYIGPKIKAAGYDRGIMDKIASPFTRPLNQIGESAYYSPAGIYQAGRAGVKDVGAARHGDFSFKRSRALGKGIAKATVEDFKHPRERSGYLALDVAGLASAGAGTASRLAAAGKAASETGRLGAVAKALAHAPEPKPRTLRSGNLEAHPLESRNKAFAAAQRAHDKAVNKAAAKNPEGKIGREYLPKKIGKTLAEERRLVTEPAAKAPAGALAKAGKKLSTPKQYALRIVAEQERGKAKRAITIQERHDFHAAQGDKRQARLTAAASKYLEDTPDGPKFKPEYSDLQDVYGRLVKVARNRDELLTSIGRLSSETAGERVSAPARIIAEGKYEKPTAGKLGMETPGLKRARQRVTSLQGRIDRAAQADDFAREQGLKNAFELKGPQRFWARNPQEKQQLRGALAVAKGDLGRNERAAAKRIKPTGVVGGEDVAGSGSVRIPYQKENAARTLFRPGGLGRGKVIGAPQTPGSLRHSFTGALLRKGGGRQNVTKLVSESNVEAQKLGEALRVRDQLKEATIPHPPERGAEDYVAMRLDNPLDRGENKKVSSLIENATRKREEGVKLSRSERRSLSTQAEDARSLFIYGSQEDIGKLSPAEQAEFARLHEEGKIGWVNKRLLGGLDQPQSLVGPGVYQITHAVDAINNATRFAVLYLKPAYAAPNVLGNLALNLVQQGFAAPANLARAARVNAKLSHDAAAKLDATMGEGFVRAISGEGGAGRKVIDAAANVWSKGVDTPFRRSAFIYEARRALRGSGVKPSWQNIDKLLTDPAMEQKLSDVVRRANKEIIDYGRLSPTEREVVRRVIFFYPWVKGSTVYAGRFVLEHPIKAAVVAKVGEQGKQFADETLGPVPSRYKGAFAVGGKFVNPSSASILGTPAQVVEGVTGALRGDVHEAAKLAQFASPALNLGIAETTRIDPQSGFDYSPKASALDIAYDQLVPGTPQASLVRNLHGAREGAVLQPTPGQAIGKFMVGGLYPQNYSKEALASAARKEQRALMTKTQRVFADHQEMRAAFMAAAKQAKLLPQNATELPKPLKEAITLRSKRYSNYAKAGVHSGQPNYQERAFQIDVATLLKWGKITQAKADKALAWAAAKSPDTLESERRRLGDKYFGGAVLSDARAKLKKAGVPVG